MAQETTQQKDPFAGFKSEEFVGGEPVAAPDTVEETAQDEGEGEASPAQESESQPPAEEEGEQTPPAKDEQPKPKKSFQERINELTRERRTAERERDALAARLRALETAPPPPKQEEQPAKPAAVLEDDPNAPKPEAFEYGELDPRYIRSLASYEANKAFSELRKQDEKARQEVAAREKQEALRTQFETMIERGSKVHEDFFEKVIIGSETGQWPLSMELGELLLTSDVGNDIAYHLASNPDEAARVYRTSPVEQARYFGRMEAKFSAERTAAPAGENGGKPAPKTPKAPPPVETARGAGGRFQASADTDDFAAFERRANQKE